MSEFAEGFMNVLQGVYFPSLSLYELGEYAAAGAIGSLCSILLTGTILLVIVAFKEVRKGKG